MDTFLLALRVVVSLGVVIGAIWFVQRRVSRSGGGSGARAKRAGKPMSVIARQNLGPKASVAVVEFGDRVRARAVTAGGESGHPDSKHFDDEAERYASGNFREVYFYPDQLKGHTERTYHPGQ